MIVSENIEVKVTQLNIEHFNKFYSNIKLLDKIIVKSEELSYSSHRKILIECDICGDRKRSTFKNYFNYLKRSKDGKYTCCKCNTEKRKNTCLKKYGVKNVANLDITKEKMKKTCIKNFGSEYIFQTDKFKIYCRELFIKKGFNVCSNNSEDWSRYQRTCMTESYKNYKTLKKEWNGFDYYDKTYIKDNYNLNPNDSNYPTVDHKMSIIYGYLNGISTTTISALENLCITKRYINSSKRHLIEENFIFYKGDNHDYNL